MPRKPVPRENYRQDAIRIHRILGAIEGDANSDQEWCAGIKPHLETALKMLLEHRPAAPAAKSARALKRAS